MQKDLKIGMVLGLALIAVCAIWISTRPQFSARSRLLQTGNVDGAREVAVQPPADEPPAVSEPETQDSQKAVAQPEIAEETVKADSSRFHTVGSGDTLSAISYKYYGSVNKVQKILEANREIIKNPNKLKPGLRIVIPE